MLRRRTEELARQRRELIRFTGGFRETLETVWQDPRFTRETRADCAHVDNFWSRIEERMRLPFAEIVDQARNRPEN